MDLISDEEDYEEPDAGEAEDVAPSDEEEGIVVDDTLPEQAILPPSPPPSA